MSKLAPHRLGVLRVVSGRADRPEYDLDAQTSLIGRSSAALVRLQGWLKPSVAVAITRRGDGYVATRVGGRPLLNDEPLHGRRRLQDGDLLQVNGLTLEFAWRHRAAAETAAGDVPPHRVGPLAGRLDLAPVRAE